MCAFSVALVDKAFVQRLFDLHSTTFLYPYGVMAFLLEGIHDLA